MIQIGKITLHYFGSARKLTYRFDRPGLNLIQGRNGAGKTTIFNALSWVLYGRLVKEKSSVTPWEIIQDSEYDGTWVKLEIKVGSEDVVIYRTQDFKGSIKGRKLKSGILILINGEIQDGLRDKNDAKEWIVKTVGYSFELFKSSVLFGQKLKRLMGEDNATKKRIMEEAFEVAYIAKANELAKAKLGEVEKEANELRIKINGLKDKKHSLEEAKENSEKAIREFEENKRKKISSLESLISVYRVRIKELKPLLKELKAKKNKLKKLNPTKLTDLVDSEFRLNMELNTEGDKLERLENEVKGLKQEFKEVPKKCVVCGSKLSRDKVKEYKIKIKDKIHRQLNYISGQKDLIERIKIKYDGVTQELASLKKLENSINSIKNRIKFLEREKNTYHSAKGQLKEAKLSLARVREEKCTINLEPLIHSCIKVNEELITANGEMINLSGKAEIYSWLIKDPLSNGGLKAFIIDSMSSSINQVLRSMKHIIGFNIKLKVNLDSAYKDIKIVVSKDKHEVPYEDLSGGQQQLVDVSIAWSIERVITATRPINIMLMDEVFESLDLENIEVIGKLLLERSQTKSIHLITHLRTFNPLNCKKTILTLNQGITEIEA